MWRGWKRKIRQLNQLLQKENCSFRPWRKICTRWFWRKRSLNSTTKRKNPHVLSFSGPATFHCKKRNDKLDKLITFYRYWKNRITLWKEKCSHKFRRGARVILGKNHTHLHFWPLRSYSVSLPAYNFIKWCFATVKVLIVSLRETAQTVLLKIIKFE